MSRCRPSAEESVRVNVEWMRLSPASRSGSGAPSGRQRLEDLSQEGADVHRDGRQLWAKCRQALHQHGTETITRGVQRLHVDEGDEAAVEEAQGCDDVDGDDDCNSDDLPDIRPLGRKATKGGAAARKGPATKSRRSKKMDDDTGRSDGEGGRNFWSVGDTIALVRAKRDQDLYFTGMGSSFARMKTREWKWKDVRARLQSMGVTRDVVDCRKKWDNLMQQFKKVHKFHNLSGGKDYFKLASKDRRSEGFSFVMDRSVYDEMEAMTKGDHTIHLKNLADTGAAGGVQMPAGVGAAGAPWPLRVEGRQPVRSRGRRKTPHSAQGVVTDMGRGRTCGNKPLRPSPTSWASMPQTVIDGGGKHVYARRRPWEEAGKHPRGQSGAGRGQRHVPKTKRLLSEEASESMPLRRGRSWTAANEEEDDDVFTMEEEAAEDNVAAPRGSTLQRSSDQSGARRLVTPPSEAQQVRAHNTQKAKEVVVDVGGEDDEPLESRR
ncbi:hypothetical protein CBR_g55868 [Chara braunii]|uniref:Myb/SANT-like DNA-binding domain-containing protein n=1 Tax=Chara braunii TaxID=69332 RepID=A0A388MDF0_CHABU|nr:hypothetical protein CBR_g55868 [Chara braunii]|eukprot:GBG92533.1 hypothetical protein CBR_g55868 [Chara braunii]